MEAKRRRRLEKEGVVTWAESCWESKTRHGQGIGNSSCCALESCFGGAVGTGAQWSGLWENGGKDVERPIGTTLQGVPLGRRAETGEVF